MARPTRQPLGQILKAMGVINEGQIQEALGVQRAEGGVIGEILTRLRHVDSDQLAAALAKQSGMEMIKLRGRDIPAQVIIRIDTPTAGIYRIVPVSFENDILTVASESPLDVTQIDDLEFMLRCKIKAALAPKADIDAAIKEYYPEEDLTTLMGSLEEEMGLKSGARGFDIGNVEEMAASAPVIKLLNLILKTAIDAKASDVHFEPFEDDFKVRQRIDGVLYEMAPPPMSLAAAVISRVKVMSNLDITETRMPQDGKIELTVSGRYIDLRVSTLPTMFGESCVIRVLDRSNVSLDLENVGLRDRELDLFRGLIQKPNGILLVTGPTGSGKTTTLYSALNEANTIDVKIITTEDPVEYDLEGIVQVQVNEEIGVTYAKCLRSILRQDPDKILVGEIRDRETAQIAVEASLTGHIVFSTLHTNDAPTSITRLIEIGIEPFLITATLEAIVAQRLVRKICVACKTSYTPSDDELMELNLSPDMIMGKQFHYGRGCGVCNSTGYRGRTAIFEIMVMSERLRQMVMDNESVDSMREQARMEGMRSLRDSGLLKIFDGMTTIEEVVRETILGN